MAPTLDIVISDNKHLEIHRQAVLLRRLRQITTIPTHIAQAFHVLHLMQVVCWLQVAHISHIAHLDYVAHAMLVGFQYQFLLSRPVQHVEFLKAFVELEISSYEVSRVLTSCFPSMPGYEHPDRCKRSSNTADQGDDVSIG